MQLMLAGAASAAGLIGIGILICAASRFLVPVEMTLATLHTELVANIATDSSAYLPSGGSGVCVARTDPRGGKPISELW